MGGCENGGVGVRVGMRMGVRICRWMAGQLDGD